jgi:uncharacterized protein (TIGR03083 family)
VSPIDALHRARIDALGEAWQAWAGVGAGLTEAEWTAASRCAGWDVAALYAHSSVFPLVLTATPPLPAGPLPDPVTAVDVLGAFNSPGGVAHEMAGTVADAAVADAARLERRELVDRFAVHGPRALQVLRDTAPTTLVPWPAAEALVTLVEGLRIVLLEATVHLLDVLRALGRPAEVPAPALRETAALLAELAPPVDLIEAAAGRVAHSPFPVLR